MKVFYDLEFHERGRDVPMTLVSIALVPEDGRTPLYRVNAEALSTLMRNPWLVVNVVPELPIDGTVPLFGTPTILSWDEKHDDYQYVAVLDQIQADVLAYLQDIPDLELWADYGAYDHVILCQLLGTMNELPAGIPMWTHEFRQLLEQYPGRPVRRQDSAHPHHALYDALWLKDAYRDLMGDRIVEGYEIDEIDSRVFASDSGVTNPVPAVIVNEPKSTTKVGDPW